MADIEKLKKMLEIANRTADVHSGPYASDAMAVGTLTHLVVELVEHALAKAEEEASLNEALREGRRYVPKEKP